MNNNFQSYQTYQGPIDEPTHQGVSIRIHDPVHSITDVDGVLTQVAHQREQGHTGQLNPYHGTDSFGATAQNPDGTPVTELLPTTLVTIDGVQASVGFWVNEGRLQKAANGTYTEATSGQQQAAPQADPTNFLHLPPAHVELVDRAMQGVDPGYAGSLIATAVGVATGQLDVSHIHNAFGQASGLDGDERSNRVGALMSVYQAQANQAITARFGVGEADLQDFYSWAKEPNQRGRLAEAMTRQIYESDISGYRALAEQWKSATPPSINALKQNGFHVREQGNGHQVYVQGQWMTPAAAARAGLV